MVSGKITTKERKRVTDVILSIIINKDDNEVLIKREPIYFQVTSDIWDLYHIYRLFKK